MLRENNTLALLPLIAGILVLTARFYVREGAISVFSASFMGAAISVLMLVGYMGMLITGHLPPYAWIGFGGVGATLTVLGLWSFYR